MTITSHGGDWMEESYKQSSILTTRMQRFIVALLVVVAACDVAALSNGLARTPQMGWNSWNHFGCRALRIFVSFVSVSARWMR